MDHYSENTASSLEQAIDLVSEELPPEIAERLRVLLEKGTITDLEQVEVALVGPECAGGVA